MVKFKWAKTVVYYANEMRGAGENRRMERVRKTRTTWVPAEGSNIFMKELMNMGQISYGQFSLPFCFTLPLNSPPSFNFFQSNEVNGRTLYQFRALGPNCMDTEEFYVTRKIDGDQAMYSG